MDNFNKVGSDIKDILYSRTVKAGKRIYYLDVKEGRNHELYMSVTESKKKTMGDPESPEVSFEKHKIFLYQEDIPNFLSALDDVLEYIHQNAPAVEPRRQWNDEPQNGFADASEQETDQKDAYEPINGDFLKDF